MNPTLRLVIVDDEPLALRRLRTLLSGEPDIDLVGEAGSIAEAQGLIEQTRPDLLLLDIRMRDGTGFELISSTAAQDDPDVVFVTAFDHYAVEAFERAAVDYLLKPVEQPRLSEALARARERRFGGHDREKLAELQEVIANLRSALHGDQQSDIDQDLWIRSANGSFTKLCLTQVDWISSEDDYAKLHVGDASYLVRSSLRTLEGKIPSDLFVRVHRSAMVRLTAISEVRRSQSGQKTVVLYDGTEVPTGRVYYRSLQDLFQKRNLLTSE